MSTPGSWLFVRDGQSIWIVRPPGHSMIVSGPGPAGIRHDFHNEDDLQAFQVKIAEELTDGGWVLSAVDRDRRASRDRRAYPRSNASDRRRVGDG
jgi:hypothetical protein